MRNLSIRMNVEQLQRNEVDLVFMDIEMPVMGGFQATRRIRSDQRWCKLPIVAMTAHAMKEDRQRCLDEGMDDYLTKPVRSQEIEEMIEKWKPSGGAETESSVAAEYSGPPEAEAADGIPTAIDLERALTQLGGDRALFDEVLETFLQTIPELLRALHDGCAACDNNAVQAVAHSLKGAASNVCAEPSRAAAQRLEEMTRRGESTGVPALVEEITTHLEGVRTAGAILLNQRGIDSTGEQA